MPVIVYSVLRLGPFALALLGRQRTAAAIWIAERRAATRPRFSPGVEADAAAEDAEVQRQPGDQGQSASPRPSSTP